MFKNAASILIILIWSQCANKGESTGVEKHLANFNVNAKETFLHNVEVYDGRDKGSILLSVLTSAL